MRRFFLLTEQGTQKRGTMTLSSMSGEALPVLMLEKFRFTEAMHLSIRSICMQRKVTSRTPHLLLWGHP